MSDWYQRWRAGKVLKLSAQFGQDSSVDHIVSYLKELQGSVLEIGPGSGNLLRYLPAGVTYTALEPNTYLHEAIVEEAQRQNIPPVNVVAAVAEHMPFPEATFDAVVSVRALCSMGDTAVTLQEIKRVLKPGGPLIFTEHVIGQPGTFTRFLQRLIRYPHKLVAGGCDPAKDIEALIKKAGFAKVELERFSKPERLIASPRIAGRALK